MDSSPPLAAFDRTHHSVTGCRTLTVADPELLGRCSEELPLCGQDQGPTVADLEQALTHEDVAASFGVPGVFNQAPGPADWYFTIALDGATIEIGRRECVAGTACREVPAGLAALRDLLDEISARSVCEPRPPDGDCLPDGRFVEDVCVSCGADGTCAKSEARCARDCRLAPATCTNEIGTTNLTTCTARGICEIGECSGG